ncbi:helix-turn-helix domain-containing protein [Streptomyces sp. NPDC051662]|uniref:helix-turn-helix domain-containing protein n=1 Tax=Streptomyces sp. NPDC051662 TaxID=3154750 RepID=UPI00341C4D5F
MDTLAALCDILDCRPNDLIEVQVVNESRSRSSTKRYARPPAARRPARSRPCAGPRSGDRRKLRGRQDDA